MLRQRLGRLASAFACGTVLALNASVAFAEPVDPNGAAGKPMRLDEVFKSLQDSTQGGGIPIPVLPLVLMSVGIVGLTIAIKYWHRRRAHPRPLHDARRLLDEAAKAAGLSKRQLRKIAPLAEADGLSSPLVALICPSAVRRLAGHVKSSDQQSALRSLARELMDAVAHEPPSLNGPAGHSPQKHPTPL